MPSRAKSSASTPQQIFACPCPRAFKRVSYWPCRRCAALKSVSPWRTKYRIGRGKLFLFADRDIGCIRMLHADDVITGIDVMHFAGDAARHVREQIGTG